MFFNISHDAIGPEDISLLQRVFDHISAEAGLPPCSVEAEHLGASLVQMLQAGVRDEAKLLSLALERQSDILKRTG